MQVKEAIALEEFEETIDEKIKSLDAYGECYFELIKRMNQFLSDYKEKMNKFTDAINKELDSFHYAFDQMDAISKESKLDLERKKEQLLVDSKYKEFTEEYYQLLSQKLDTEAKALEEDFSTYLDKFHKEFEDSQEGLKKAMKRLNKLKDRSVGGIK